MQRCRVVNVCTVVATGVNAEGRREILGFDVFTTEYGAGWTAFMRDLVSRGLSGVLLVISDAHNGGLKDVVASVLPGACWPGYPRRPSSWWATMVRSIFAQPGSAEVWTQHGRVVTQLEEHFADASSLLAEAGEEILAFKGLSRERWHQIWSNNPPRSGEIRRRTDVVGIFPNRSSIIRLVGAVLAEQNDEWFVARRYMSCESVAKVHRATEGRKRGENPGGLIQSLDPEHKPPPLSLPPGYPTSRRKARGARPRSAEGKP